MTQPSGVEGDIGWLARLHTMEPKVRYRVWNTGDGWLGLQDERGEWYVATWGLRICQHVHRKRQTASECHRRLLRLLGPPAGTA